MKGIKRDSMRLYVFTLGLLLAGQCLAQGVTGREDWDYLAEVYLWGPNIDIENTDGSHQEVEFSDLVDVTKGGFMGGFYGQGGEWRFGVDAIYLDADDRVNATLVEGIKLNEVGLEAWLVSPTVAYRLAGYDRSEFYLYGGARYLWAEYAVTIKTREPLPQEKVQSSESDSRWDGFIGLHGTTRLSDNWYVAYQADIGTGQSDAVYQFVGGLNYRFNSFDLALGYRYMRWDLDSSLFNEIEFNGFYAGAKIFF